MEIQVEKREKVLDTQKGPWEVPTGAEMLTLTEKITSSEAIQVGFEEHRTPGLKP